eukprot:Partr_v1_DN28756_c1_g2_i2_m61682 putative zinc finger
MGPFRNSRSRPDIAPSTSTLHKQFDGKFTDSNSTTFKSGDWYCPGCHTHNFARRDTCFRCRGSKPDIEHNSEAFDGPAPSISDQSGAKRDDLSGEERLPFAYPRGTKSRRGDWGCADAKCRAVNFASRKQCHQCNADKPPQPDEWECKRCGFENKDFRSECMKCKFAGNVDGPKKNLRVGDWTCAHCNDYNFARRTECYKCKRSKDEVIADIPDTTVIL